MRKDEYDELWIVYWIFYVLWNVCTLGFFWVLRVTITRAINYAKR